MILVVSTGVNGDDFRMGAESCRWVSMQAVAHHCTQSVQSHSHKP